MICPPGSLVHTFAVVWIEISVAISFILFGPVNTLAVVWIAII